MRTENFSAGILSKIYITKKYMFWNGHDSFDLRKEIDNVLKDIGRFIDVSAYDIEELDEGIYSLSLKADFINDNLYDLLMEMKEMTNSNFFVNCLDNGKDNVIEKDKVSCSLTYDDYSLKNGRMKSSKFSLTPKLFWLLSDKKLLDNVLISGSILPIWFDFNNTGIEDATPLLKALNIMKTRYFKSKLSKCLVFEKLS